MHPFFYQGGSVLFSEHSNRQVLISRETLDPTQKKLGNWVDGFFNLPIEGEQDESKPRKDAGRTTRLVSVVSCSRFEFVFLSVVLLWLLGLTH